MITLRQLFYLETLAATRHFGRAAESLGISQPALSMQVRELERALGGRLFDRLPDGAVLTDLGEEVVRRGRSILAAVQDLEAVAAARAGTLSGALRVGMIPTIAPYLLPEFIARTSERYPKLRLTVREAMTGVLVAELASGQLDAIIASVPLTGGDFEEAPAFEDRFYLATSADSELIRSPAMPEDIDGESLLLLEDGHCLRDQALAACRVIDPARMRTFGTTSLATVLHLVAAGHGVTFLPAIAAGGLTQMDPRLRLVNFAEPAPSRTVGLAWRRGSPRGDDFRALTETLQEAGEAVLQASVYQA